MRTATFTAGSLAIPSRTAASIAPVVGQSAGVTNPQCRKVNLPSAHVESAAPAHEGPAPGSSAARSGLLKQEDGLAETVPCMVSSEEADGVMISAQILHL